MKKNTVTMQGGPCSQTATGNTSQLNQPQSVIYKIGIVGARAQLGSWK